MRDMTTMTGPERGSEPSPDARGESGGESGGETGLEPTLGWRKFSRLCSRDEKERASALETLTQSVLLSARAGQGDEPALQRDTLVELLRVSRTCPFSDIRERAAELLNAAKEGGVEIPQPMASGPSTFIPANEILEDGMELPELMEVFLASGRVDHVTMVMALHPAYLGCFLRTQQALLQPDGPLPQHCRHYIIMMASARHRCSYLVQLHSEAFLQTGGDELWLRGLQYAPAKLRHLGPLNKLLAHRPWLITQEHIADLVCPSSEERWSLAELIQAVVLLVHAHSLCSFVWGCGVTPELDHPGGHVFLSSSPSACPSCSPRSTHSPAGEAAAEGGANGEREVELLMKTMQLLQRQQQEEEEDERSQEELVTRFEKERDERLPSLLSEEVLSAPHDGVSCFVEDADFAYRDFAPRGEQSPPTLRAQDYSWEDHGFSLMNRLYPDLSQLLDEKFQVVLGLTYHTMAMHCDVDTFMLRKAVWNYIHCIFGIRYDDYDYGDVNHLLELSLKVYIKTVACYPEKTSRRMYTGFWRHFRHSEKVHVNLLLLEARLQAALLYALRAITRYMT